MAQWNEENAIITLQLQHLEFKLNKNISTRFTLAF